MFEMQSEIEQACLALGDWGAEVVLFETRFGYVSQAGLEVVTVLPQFPKC